MLRMVEVEFQGKKVTLREAVALAGVGTRAAKWRRTTLTSCGNGVHSAKKVVRTQIGVHLNPLVNAPVHF